ncbi:sugar kinase [Streptomyces sp. NPDC047000]|uniref:sugar kinase n=1 Tax=Streptomyces sp. NPDC047000 TaxID=3155474 RepID=UPI0033CEC7B3
MKSNASRPRTGPGRPVRVLAIGECMTELVHLDGCTLRLGYAGDTFNTAVYLARCTDPGQVEVDYLTMLGNDHYSEGIVAALRREGIGTAPVQRIDGAQPGLYLVDTDAAGERTFTYYRSQSAARQLFGPLCPPEVDRLPAEYDVVYLSAVTLHILPPRARERLLTALRAARARGTDVVFDSNYRPAGWPDPGTARAAVSAAWRLTTIALPTFTDEAALFDDSSAAGSVARLTGLGIPEVVVKDGARGCVVWDGERPRPVAVTAVPSIVDTTAAGDAFNGGYLAARLTGSDPLTAARRAGTLAGQVIGHRGAVLPAAVLPPRAYRAEDNTAPRPPADAVAVGGAARTRTKDAR